MVPVYAIIGRARVALCGGAGSWRVVVAWRLAYKLGCSRRGGCSGGMLLSMRVERRRLMGARQV